MSGKHNKRPSLPNPKRAFAQRPAPPSGRAKFGKSAPSRSIHGRSSGKR